MPRPWQKNAGRQDPKDLLYGELATGTRPTGRPKLRNKDFLKRDLEDCDVGVSWETIATDCVKWRSSLKGGVKISESRRELIWEEKRARIRQQAQAPAPAGKDIAIKCPNCSCACKSRIGMFSHTRRCSQNLHQDDG